MAKYKSGGWFKQSTRHSNARKLGRAGGSYASDRIRTILKKHPEYEKLTFKQLKKKGVFLRYQSDSDKDRVINIKDCRPLNKKAQDNGEERKLEFEQIKGTGLLREKEPSKTKMKIKEFLSKTEKQAEKAAKKGLKFIGEEAKELKKKAEESIEEHNRKKREAISKAVAEATKERLMDKTSLEERKEILDELEEANQVKGEDVSHIFTGTSPEESAKIAEKTSKLMTRASHKAIDDLSSVDVKELSDDELKTIAVRLGTGFFSSGSRFENELKRRIRERERIATDLQVEVEKSRMEHEKRLKKIKEDANRPGFFDGLFN